MLSLFAIGEAQHSLSTLYETIGLSNVDARGDATWLDSNNNKGWMSCRNHWENKQEGPGKPTPGQFTSVRVAACSFVWNLHSSGIYRIYIIISNRTETCIIGNYSFLCSTRAVETHFKKT